MQIVIDRHHFVLSVGAAMSPNDKFDLLIKGGDVLDPSQRSGNTPGMPFLTWVMSKFLDMGFSLEEVITMTTVNAARAIDRVPRLGTLQVGAPGDVTMLELVEGPVEFVDMRNNKRAGKMSLRPVQTVSAGIAFGRPYSAPFSVR